MPWRSRPFLSRFWRKSKDVSSGLEHLFPGFGKLGLIVIFSNMFFLKYFLFCAFDRVVCSILRVMVCSPGFLFFVGLFLYHPGRLPLRVFCLPLRSKFGKAELELQIGLNHLFFIFTLCFFVTSYSILRDTDRSCY